MIITELTYQDPTPKMLSDQEVALEAGKKLVIKCDQLPEQRVLSAGTSALKLAGAGAIAFFLWNNRDKIQESLETALGL